MIHRYLKNQAQVAIPEIKWTINYYAGKNDVAAIYTESGGLPDTYDFKWRYPEYMVFIRMKDWDKAEVVAEKVRSLFHNKEDFRVEEKGRFFYIQSIYALSEPLRLGVSEDDKMEYSINFRATLREEKDYGRSTRTN